MSPARWIAVALVSAAVAAGVFFWSSNLRRPDDGREDQVADAPAGGRTQAEGPAAESDAAGIAVDPPGDPLVAGIPESPDIPPDHAHMGIQKVGERIRAAVLEDGSVGDEETPGVVMTGLTQTQRKWYLEHAVAITCPCGCRQDLLECRRDDATCPTSPGLSDSLLAEARKH
jgi:hypothetical protein